jgi:hypothetical protein
MLIQTQPKGSFKASLNILLGNIDIQQDVFMMGHSQTAFDQNWGSISEVTTGVTFLTNVSIGANQTTKTVDLLIDVQFDMVSGSNNLYFYNTNGFILGSAITPNIVGKTILRHSQLFLIG